MEKITSIIKEIIELDDALKNEKSKRRMSEIITDAVTGTKQEYLIQGVIHIEGYRNTNIKQSILETHIAELINDLEQIPIEEREKFMDLIPKRKFQEWIILNGFCVYGVYDWEELAEFSGVRNGSTAKKRILKIINEVKKHD